MLVMGILVSLLYTEKELESNSFGDDDDFETKATVRIRWDK